VDDMLAMGDLSVGVFCSQKFEKMISIQIPLETGHDVFLSFADSEYCESFDIFKKIDLVFLLELGIFVPQSQYVFLVDQMISDLGGGEFLQIEVNHPACLGRDSSIYTLLLA
jgi:hypothetical protein